MSAPTCTRCGTVALPGKTLCRYCHEHAERKARERAGMLRRGFVECPGCVRRKVAVPTLVKGRGVQCNGCADLEEGAL